MASRATSRPTRRRCGCTHTAVIENGFVHIPETAPWLAEYLHELAVFPNGKHDDQATSTAQFLDWFKRPFAGQGICRQPIPVSANRTTSHGPNENPGFSRGWQPHPRSGPPSASFGVPSVRRRPTVRCWREWQAPPGIGAVQTLSTAVPVL